ncbi:MAG: trehalose-phosphatase [Candidatus Omnitrophota bacterium]
MQYGLDKLEQIKNNLRNKDLFLFLDYDGTLAPIASTPEKAVFSEETRGILRQLIQKSNCKLAIISGRQLSDIKQKIGLENIIYSGNHGLEIQGPKLKHKANLQLLYIKALMKIKNLLITKLAEVEGVIIEDKGISLCVHYRLVKKEDISRVKIIFHETIINYLVNGLIMIKPGKRAIDIRPATWMNKGKVVMWLLARERFRKQGYPLLPIYIGDDLTDEDAFIALKDIGITIRVGKNKDSQAQYYFRNTNEVKIFLKMILIVLNK